MPNEVQHFTASDTSISDTLLLNASHRWFSDLMIYDTKEKEVLPLTMIILMIWVLQWSTSREVKRCCIVRNRTVRTYLTHRSWIPYLGFQWMYFVPRTGCRRWKWPTKPYRSLEEGLPKHSKPVSCNLCWIGDQYLLFYKKRKIIMAFSTLCTKRYSRPETPLTNLPTQSRYSFGAGVAHEFGPSLVLQIMTVSILLCKGKGLEKVPFGNQSGEIQNEKRGAGGRQCRKWFIPNPTTEVSNRFPGSWTHLPL